MGLFHFKKQPEKKQPEKQPEKKIPSQEEVVQLWNNAYRANPQIYQKKDSDALLGSCALSEGVDTLLPLHPESTCTANGKPIHEWILSLVSITEQRILGQMEYQEAMKRLRPFSLAMSKDLILIRAMTHKELDGLFEGLPRQLV
ncbi:hypothetical protein [uncultured Dysosmobacter sp.]|uniref:hypothetical protein n=1 Tax=uncultured Dysosmobacter sp. TaxID=2591384 RepID=UPI00263610B3|nr:hypothetical protein [uncultured Dysosmobacter sp.]